MENSNDTGKVIGALLIGVLAGAALGVLFAPDKGSKTRSKIAGGAKDITEGLKKKIMDEVNALRIKAEELENLADEKVEEMASNIKQKASEILHPN